MSTVRIDRSALATACTIAPRGLPRGRGFAGLCHEPGTFSYDATRDAWLASDIRVFAHRAEPGYTLDTACMDALRDVDPFVRWPVTALCYVEAEIANEIATERLTRQRRVGTLTIARAA